MKGIVFTEFIEMMETQFSPQMAAEIIEQAAPESGGAYTSVGTYDHQELVALVVELSRRTNTPVPVLLHAFGRYLLTTFSKAFPQFFDRAPNTFAMLEQVDSYIHIEVRKLYPDAELPRFTTKRIGDDQFEMIYSSKRHFEDLAHGLIEATVDYFQESITITKKTGIAETIFHLTSRDQ